MRYRIKAMTRWGGQYIRSFSFAADESVISPCARIYSNYLLGVDEVRLLGNNRRSQRILTEAGINIVERVPLIVGRNPCEHYLDTKAAKMGHLLSKWPAGIKARGACLRQAR